MAFRDPPLGVGVSHTGDTVGNEHRVTDQAPSHPHTHTQDIRYPYQVGDKKPQLLPRPAGVIQRVPYLFPNGELNCA